MPRSKVLRGVNKQLNRAQLRKRLDRKRKSYKRTTDEDTAIAKWLKENIPNNIETTASLNLTSFLRETGNIDIAPPEKLRKLAIYLQENFQYNGLRGWLVVERVYQLALKLDPEDTWLHHSRAVTASIFAEQIEIVCNDRQTWKNSRTRQRMMKVAYKSGYKALSLTNNDVDILYLMGDLHYFDPDFSQEKALHYYEKALAVDPNHGWAQLYRAHCLHDLEKWLEAARAYEQINPAFFTGSRSWRYEYLLEQKAYCYFKANHIAQAQIEFEALLHRWEKNPHLAEKGWGTYLVEIAQQHQPLLKPTTALVKRQGWTAWTKLLSDLES